MISFTNGYIENPTNKINVISKYKRNNMKIFLFEKPTQLCNQGQW